MSGFSARQVKYLPSSSTVGVYDITLSDWLPVSENCRTDRKRERERKGNWMAKVNVLTDARRQRRSEATSMATIPIRNSYEATSTAVAVGRLESFSALHISITFTLSTWRHSSHLWQHTPALAGEDLWLCLYYVFNQAATKYYSDSPNCRAFFAVECVGITFMFHALHILRCPVVIYCIWFGMIWRRETLRACLYNIAAYWKCHA